MQNERVIRAVVFVVFFSIGAAVLSATILCDDLLEYYYYKGLLNQSEGHLKKLESLNADYDTLLAQLEGNPKELARLAPATPDKHNKVLEYYWFYQPHIGMRED